MIYRLLILPFVFLFVIISESFCDDFQESEMVKKTADIKPYPEDSSLILAYKDLESALEQNDSASVQQSHYQLGYIYYNKNNFEKSDEHLTQSLIIARSRNDENGISLALNRLGNVRQLQTNYLEALDLYQNALKINQLSENNAEIARTLVNLANVYSIIGQYQLSIEHFLQALDIHQSTDDKEGLAWTSLGIARLFKRLNLLDRAMEYAQNALDYYRVIEKKTGNSVGVTLSLSELGSIYHKLGDYDKAQEYSYMVLEINEANENIHGQASNHISLGVIFLDQNENSLARKHLTKALRLKQIVGDSLDLSSLYRFLGKVELRDGNTQRALQYFSQSKAFAHKHRLIPDLSESYLSLSEVYSKIGQKAKALEAYKTHSIYKDSLNSSDIARLEMQYEFEKREKEQELLSQQREALQEARLERQRVVLIFFIIGFILAGSLAAFIFYSYREKKRVNQLLLNQNNEIRRQKQEIESQKEEIEQQRDFVTLQRDKIANQQRLITDSITYASRIQSAILPSKETLKKLPWESFVLYKPKNIVSGDFYWVSYQGNSKILLAAADCTGHGVPGAFMSMLGVTLLREIAGKHGDNKPDEILMKLREMVILSLNQQPGRIDQTDGMDMALTQIDPSTLEMLFAGAYLSAVVVRNGDVEVEGDGKNPRVTQADGLSLIEYRGDKMPIGHHVLKKNPFKNQAVQLKKGDMLYLFSDGYIDQFGGENNTKFLLYNFRKLLLSIHNEDVDKQHQILNKTIEEYRGDKKQVDDMLVIGVRIA
ncbi:MAG: tetratricopeptide repeat protein [Bacteroidales bacterium]